MRIILTGGLYSGKTTFRDKVAKLYHADIINSSKHAQKESLTEIQSLNNDRQFQSFIELNALTNLIRSNWYYKSHFYVMERT